MRVLMTRESKMAKAHRNNKKINKESLDRNHAMQCHGE